jgi:hypothetical protein
MINAWFRSFKKHFACILLHSWFKDIEKHFVYMLLDLGLGISTNTSHTYSCMIGLGILKTLCMQSHSKINSLMETFEQHCQ